uniref:Glycosyltransferase family 15 protein n=2 Tax=Moniliophthora roreri TaxID=221103 RepID=A0A0W0F3C2_MONRR
MTVSRARLALFIAIFIACLVIFFPAGSLHETYQTYLLSSPSSGRPNAVIFMLVPPSRLQQAILALLSVENRFNRRLKYPYVLFMSKDELTTVSDDVKAKISWITEGRAEFAAVTEESWEIPEFYDQRLVDASMHDIGFSKGYRQMCRFYSGFFWRNPAVTKYEWLWRLDTDIEFHCDIPYDPVQRMIDANALYGFIQISPDADWVQPSLASNVSAFLRSHSDLVHSHQSHPNMGFTWRGREGIENAMNGVGGNDDWTRMCMYNNFEISHRTIWESRLYTTFFEYLDRAGGFFYERWSDSPIHSFGVAMSLRKDQVMQFRDMGYQHQGWGYECPAHLDRCTCVKEGDIANFHDNAEAWFNATDYDTQILKP